MILGALKYVLALIMIAAGVLHFAQPESFVRIVPKILPYPRELVYVSGFFEILGGVGLIVPLTQRMAAWGLVALFIAVFPANLNMAVNNLPFGKVPNPWVNWGRLPLQAVLIYWAWLYTRI